MLADLLAEFSLGIAITATIVLFALVGLAIFLTNLKVKYSKKLLFILIILATILPTLFFIGSTVYLNVISSSKGPVHWHADMEIWACGEELDIVDPEGFSNKVGTPILHEHNDKRIHLEGVVVVPEDASLGNFFRVIDGTLSDRILALPTVNGEVSYTDGQSCPDGTTGQVQVFVYSTENGVYSQRKISNPAAYEISPYSQVPEGDCVIVEFAPEKDMTDKLCRSYRVAEEIGDISKGGQQDGN